MGFGDEIMATADARRLHRETGLPVAIGNPDDPRRKVRWSEVFEHNPILASQACVASGANVAWCDNVSGHRPYIDYDAVLACGLAAIGRGHGRKRTIKAAGRWIWRAGQVTRAGEIFLSRSERDRARTLADEFGNKQPLVVIEPNVKVRASPNKAWPFDRWQAIVDALAPDIAFVQLGPPGVRELAGVTRRITRTFREAAMILEWASAVATTEGGLHHAAAALKVPAVVIFGGFISPAVTGYAGQTNFFRSHPSHPLGCGWRTPCGHCRAAMAAIRPGDVAEAIHQRIRN